MKGQEKLSELSPWNSVRAKNSPSSVFETVLSETVLGPFPTIPRKSSESLWKTSEHLSES